MATSLSQTQNQSGFFAVLMVAITSLALWSTMSTMHVYSTNKSENLAKIKETADMDGIMSDFAVEVQASFFRHYIEHEGDTAEITCPPDYALCNLSSSGSSENSKLCHKGAAGDECKICLTNFHGQVQTAGGYCAGVTGFGGQDVFGDCGEDNILCATLAIDANDKSNPPTDKTDLEDCTSCFVQPIKIYLDIEEPSSSPSSSPCTSNSDCSGSDVCCSGTCSASCRCDLNTEPDCNGTCETPATCQADDTWSSCGVRNNCCTSHNDCATCARCDNGTCESIDGCCNDNNDCGQCHSCRQDPDGRGGNCEPSSPGTACGTCGICSISGTCNEPDSCGDPNPTCAEKLADLGNPPCKKCNDPNNTDDPVDKCDDHCCLDTGACVASSSECIDTPCGPEPACNPLTHKCCNNERCILKSETCCADTPTCTACQTKVACDGGEGWTCTGGCSGSTPCCSGTNCVAACTLTTADTNNCLECPSSSPSCGSKVSKCTPPEVCDGSGNCVPPPPPPNSCPVRLAAMDPASQSCKYCPDPNANADPVQKLGDDGKTCAQRLATHFHKSCKECPDPNFCVDPINKPDDITKCDGGQYTCCSGECLPQPTCTTCWNINTCRVWTPNFCDGITVQRCKDAGRCGGSCRRAESRSAGDPNANVIPQLDVWNCSRSLYCGGALDGGRYTEDEKVEFCCIE